MMRLTVVRHTQVDVPKGICYGVSDVPLSEEGIAAMESVIEILKNEHFDVIYTSPLGRCRILAKTLRPGVASITEARLSELDFGDWEMKPWAEIYKTEEGKRWFGDYVATPCPNGRSYNDMLNDMEAFLTELQRSGNEHVLLVTHAGVIRVLIALLENKTPQQTFEIPLQYGEIRQFDIEIQDRKY
jgi:alpha-ribazole phosphatase